MKRKVFFFGLISAMLVMFMSGCNNPTNSNPEKPADQTDKSTLVTSIGAAEAAKTGVLIGTQDQFALGMEYVSQVDLTTLNAAIAVAEAVRGNSSATQAEVYGAVDTLNAAVQVFKNQVKTDGKKTSGFLQGQLTALISAAEAAKQGVVTSDDGRDVNPGTYWVTLAVLTTFDNAITDAKTATDATDGAARDTLYTALGTALTAFNTAKQSGTKAKTVTITGLPSSANGSEIEVGIFATKPSGPTDTPVAGGEGTVASGSAIAPLYNISDESLWTGTGNWYVGFAILEGENIQAAYVTKAAKSFSATVYNVNIALTDCDAMNLSEGPSGSITFTGIGSQYNGQYASFRSSSTTPPSGGEDYYLFGGSNISPNGITGVLISGGSATIPIQLVNSKEGSAEPYKGSDKNIKIYLSIKPSASFTFDELVEDVYIMYTINSVNFTNGGASVVLPSGGEGDGGSITFTGIDSQYNEQYASFRSSGNTRPTGGYYLGGSTSSGGITGAQISGGSVTIPVYLVNSAGAITGPYNGNDKGIIMYLSIKPSASFTFDELRESTYQKYRLDSVNFTNGNASVESVSGGGSKTVTITGLSDYNGATIQVGIFATQPTDPNAPPLAGGGGTIANGRVTVSLQDMASSNWSGTSSYYVGFTIGDDAYATKTEKPFSEGNISVTLEEFESPVTQGI
jgi:hypothetical protein